MEMHQVRYFLAVARILNFTRAAEECHVAQPSLTRAIKQLEEELGGDLFRRERNLTHLTDFGARMLPLLKQCFDSALAAKALAMSMRTGAVTPLTVALSKSMNLALMVPYFKELARAFPGLELSILRGASAELAELLKKGEAEIAVGGPLGEEWERFDSWALFSEDFYLAVSPAHPLAKRKAVDSTDLSMERILARGYCETAAEFASFVKSRNLEMCATHRPTSDDDLVALLEADFGVAIVPATAVMSDRIKLIPVEDLSLTRTVNAYGVAGRQRSAPAIALIRMLRAADWSRYANEDLRASA